ncbi:polyadenylate-binding protein 8 [Citrus sinensis]|uniref:Polyadenylate-binding protein 8 n=1 Tax=Citrus sinensis TaxID=2711 RepID=A0ACB8ISH2_CITSI|nr:polyadenylate-binding protein 8 [Citrus sinensis]
MEVSLRAHNNNDSAILGTLFSLYVGDLDSTVTEQQLIQTFSFSKLEGLASAMLCVDSFHRRSLRYGYANFHSFHCDGKSKGYGFVQYSTPESALNAIEKLYAATVEGMELYLYVGPFIRRAGRIQESASFNNLYEILRVWKNIK